MIHLIIYDVLLDRELSELRAVCQKKMKTRIY